MANFNSSVREAFLIDSLSLLPNSGTASNDARDIERRDESTQKKNVMLKFAHKSWVRGRHSHSTPV